MPNIMMVECNQSQQNHRHNTDVLFFKIVPLAIGFGYDIKILQYKLIGQLQSWRVKSPAVRAIIIANSLVKQMLTCIKLPQHHKSPPKVSVIFRGSSSLCQYDVGYITSWGSCSLAWGGSAQQSNFSALNFPPHLEASANARLPFINTCRHSLHFHLRFVLHQRVKQTSPSAKWISPFNVWEWWLEWCSWGETDMQCGLFGTSAEKASCTQERHHSSPESILGANERLPERIMGTVGHFKLDTK